MRVWPFVMLVNLPLAKPRAGCPVRLLAALCPSEPAESGRGRRLTPCSLWPALRSGAPIGQSQIHWPLALPAPKSLLSVIVSSSRCARISSGGQSCGGSSSCGGGCCCRWLLLLWVGGELGAQLSSARGANSIARGQQSGQRSERQVVSLDRIGRPPARSGVCSLRRACCTSIK